MCRRLAVCITAVLIQSRQRFQPVKEVDLHAAVFVPFHRGHRKQIQSLYRCRPRRFLCQQQPDRIIASAERQPFQSCPYRCRRIIVEHTAVVRHHAAITLLPENRRPVCRSRFRWVSGTPCRLCDIAQSGIVTAEQGTPFGFR